MVYENDFLRAAVSEFRGIGCQGGSCYPPRNRWGATGGKGGSYPKGMPSAVAAKIAPGSRKAKQWGALEKHGAKAERKYNRDTAGVEKSATMRRGSIAARKAIAAKIKAGKPVSAAGRAQALAKAINARRSGG